VEDPAFSATELLADDHAAFRAIFHDHFEHVWHMLRRLGVPPADLEDLTQEVFVTFYRRRSDYDPSRRLLPWLLGIAHRVALAHQRRRWRKIEVLGVEPSDIDNGGALPDERLALEQDRALVTQALGCIELDRRAVFVMHELDGASMPEIADALRIPLNTAYSRLRLARADFALAVQRFERRRR
jgi:RNA polymerase sigma-70 factor (ECF subfamily)